MVCDAAHDLRSARIAKYTFVAVTPEEARAMVARVPGAGDAEPWTSAHGRCFKIGSHVLVRAPSRGIDASDVTAMTCCSKGYQAKSTLKLKKTHDELVARTAASARHDTKRSDDASDAFSRAGRIPFVTVDAFTSVKYRGNPAAVVLLPAAGTEAAEANDRVGSDGDGDGGGGDDCGTDGFPSNDVLEAIAKEMNLSETAFVVPRAGLSGDASREGDEATPPFREYSLRWFTPSGAEVNLCGHATLATAHALWDVGGGVDHNRFSLFFRGGGEGA